MSIEFFVARAWRYASLIGLVMFLFLTYSGMPEVVGVHFDPKGNADGFIPRSNFFYLIVGLTLVANVLPIMIVKPFGQIPDDAFRKWPNAPLWLGNREGFNEVFGNWMHFLSAVVNTIIIFCIKIIGKLNDNQYHVSVGDYEWLLWMGIFLFLAWLFFFPLRILFGKPYERQ
jgi:hypothetical protein